MLKWRKSTNGTEVKNYSTDLGEGASADYKNSFEVTTESKVLVGDESTLHYSTGTPDRHRIDIMVDGLKKNDAFRVMLDTDTRAIEALPYIGKDTDGHYKGNIKTFHDSALADKIEAAWNAAVKLQPGENNPVITGAEVKALAGIVQEVKGAANKIPCQKTATTECFIDK